MWTGAELRERRADAGRALFTGVPAVCSVGDRAGVPGRRWETGSRVYDGRAAERHAVRAAMLPMIHSDPFDRVLVAQAQLESMPIITTDAAITRYDVETIW